MEKNAENKKIGSFTGLRFIMIIVIVVSHFEFLEKLQSFGDFYKNHLHNPTMAVDFFFLLSGFGMMLGNLMRIKTEELKFPAVSGCIKYGINHIKKIYPVYIATIVFGICGQITLAIYKSELNFSFFYHELPKIIANIPLLQSATGMMFFSHAYNGVAWFLSALFCIYLVAPILFYVLRKTSKSIVTDFIILISNIVFIIVLAIVFGKIEQKIHGIKGIPNIDNLVYGSPYRRIFYVLCGMNLAMIFQRLKDKSFMFITVKANLFEIIICILSILYFFTRNILPDGNYKYLIDVCLCASFVFVFAFDKGCVSKFLNEWHLQKLGNIAMYIFLIHYPIRIYFGLFVEKLFGWTPISSIFFIVFILFLTFALSYIIYKKLPRK